MNKITYDELKEQAAIITESVRRRGGRGRYYLGIEQGGCYLACEYPAGKFRALSPTMTKNQLYGWMGAFNAGVRSLEENGVGNGS